MRNLNYRFRVKANNVVFIFQITPNRPKRMSMFRILKKMPLLFLVCILILSCEKEEPITYFDSKVNPEMLARHFFKEGTYWVYEKENSAMEDSIVVAGTVSGYKTMPCPHGCPNRRISRNYHSIMYFTNITQGSSWNYFFLDSHFKYNGGGEYGHLGQPIFMYDEPAGSQFNGARIVGHSDSMTVLGNTFHDVTLVRIIREEQFDPMFSTDLNLYFAEHSGLIRKEIVHQTGNIEIWNLKRYHVVQ